MPTGTAKKKRQREIGKSYAEYNGHSFTSKSTFNRQLDIKWKLYQVSSQIETERNKEIMVAAGHGIR